MSEINIVVLGTSMMWGQGLEDYDKIHNVLARMLTAKDPDALVKTTFLAHSGASTGFKPDGSVDTHHEPRIHGEVPTLYPTILQEIEEFDASGIDPASIELVLLDAGINDVNVERILNPFVSPDEIKEQVEIYCHQHMIVLLDQLLAKFTNAKIIITGYYEFITEKSEAGTLRLLLTALNRVPDNPITELILKAADDLLKTRMILNCDTFVEQSFLAFQDAATQANLKTGSERVQIVRSNFKDENAIFASDPWLFGINEDFSAQDTLAEIRAEACDDAGILRTQPIFCHRASLGHPNPKGAKGYAEAIFALL